MPASPGSDKPRIRVSIDGKDKDFRAEEISAMVLEEMKRIAEIRLGAFDEHNRTFNAFVVK